MCFFISFCHLGRNKYNGFWLKSGTNANFWFDIYGAKIWVYYLSWKSYFWRKLILTYRYWNQNFSFSLTNCLNWSNVLVGRVFADGLGDWSWDIPKTQKMVLDASLLNTQHYKVRIKGKVEKSKKRSSTSPTPWGSSDWKGSLWISLDYGCQLYLLFIYLPISGDKYMRERIKLYLDSD